MKSKIKTRKRFSLVSADYSSQEVRMFASNTQDPSMLKVFAEGRDLYSEVASMVYHLPYTQCTEFDENGEFNLEGKKRRTACKSLILGLQYGRGIKSIAEQIKSHDGPVTKEDISSAKKLSDDFFHNYPKAKEWMEGNYRKAREIGYVEDLWGRRRHLPDASLPKYSIKSMEAGDNKVNPLIGFNSKGKEPDKYLVLKYTQRLDGARTKEARDIICAEAKKEGLEISCNSGFIAQAERQSINAPIQGGSATMTKLAMRNMYRDELLNKLDFHLLIPVHDEIIAECPIYNLDQAKKRMEELMIHAGEPECPVQMKCDATSVYRWYEDVFEAHAKEEYEKHMEEGMTSNESFNKVCIDNSEFTPEEIKKILGL